MRKTGRSIRITEKDEQIEECVYENRDIQKEGMACHTDNAWR